MTVLGVVPREERSAVVRGVMDVRDGFATTSESGRAGDVPAPALGASSLRSSTPSAGAGYPSKAIFFLSLISLYTPPPYSN